MPIWPLGALHLLRGCIAESAPSAAKQKFPPSKKKKGKSENLPG